MSELENLTYIQKAALEGEIALTLVTSNHKADVAYRAYKILSGSEDQEVIAEALKEMSSLSEEEVDQIVLAIRNKEIPIQLWIDKVVADIETILNSSGMSYASHRETIGIDKREIKKVLVKSYFLYFARVASIICSKATKLLCEYILTETRLDFLYDSCVFILEGLSSVPQKSKITADIFDVLLDAEKMLCYQAEKEALKNTIKLSEVDNDEDYENLIYEIFKSPKRKKAKESKVPSKTNTKRLDQELVSLLEKSKKKTKKQTSYVVQKIKNGTQLATNVGTFSTREEAISFIEDIRKFTPELMESYTYAIVKETRE